MKIIVDNREHGLLDIFKSSPPPSTVGIECVALNLGDVLIGDDTDTKTDNKTIIENPAFIIERKSFADLLSSIKDGRYEEQSFRLIQSSGIDRRRIIYVIEGVFSSRLSAKDKKMIYSAMTSLSQYKGFSVVRTASLSETADWLIHFVDKIERETKKNNTLYTEPALVHTPTHTDQIAGEKTDETGDTEELQTSAAQETSITAQETPQYCSATTSTIKQKKNANITPENIGIFMLCQIPSVQYVTATALMTRFSTIANLIDALKTDPKCLDTQRVGTGETTRKISKQCVKNIVDYLL